MAPGSPLHETLARVAAGAPAGTLPVTSDRLPVTGDGWHDVAALHADPRALAEVLDGVKATWGTDRDDIAGTAWLSDLGFALLLRAVVAFLAARRVPDLGAPGTAVRLHEAGWIEGVAVADGFTCLPDDPAAGHPAAQVVPDEDALLRHLLVAYAAHRAPLIEVVAQRTRRPRAALWRHAADVLAEAFLWAGDVVADRDAAWAWGERAVTAAPGRLRTHAGFRVWHHPGGEQAGRVRAGCCLYYRCDASSYCFSCPLKDEDHRQAWLAAQAGVAEAA